LPLIIIEIEFEGQKDPNSFNRDPFREEPPLFENVSSILVNSLTISSKHLSILFDNHKNSKANQFSFNLANSDIKALLKFSL
jgi:hypothetical protein